VRSLKRIFTPRGLAAVIILAGVIIGAAFFVGMSI
jgi:hypothetical protein